MNKSTFSILTPVYIHNQNRKKQLLRAIDSVANQTYGQLEDQVLHEQIIVNDGSPVKADEELDAVCIKYPWIKLISKKAHEERIISYNQAFELAKHDWFVFLDSDDMLSPYYLSAVAEMISRYPDYKVFNFGSVHFHPDCRVTVRGVFKPKKLEIGHEIFGGGRIVNGTFVFHRSCYEDLGGFPHFTNPWDFSTTAQEEYPEIKPMFTVVNEDHPQGLPRELGNPWGQDFYYFYKLTRKYHSMPIEAHLYWVFQKGTFRLRE